MQAPIFKRLVIPILLLIAIVIFSSQPLWVEKYYTNGVYNHIIAPFFRLLFGWIPFSIGDIIYLVAIVWLLVKIFVFFKQKKWKKLKANFVTYCYKLILGLLWIYNIFMLLWGINYSRPGIANQLNIKPKQYQTENIITLINYHDSVLKSLDTAFINDANNYNFSVCKKFAKPIYDSLHLKYNFINYKNASIKKSIFGKTGNYMGFFGYLNPFTNEAQINNHTPYFLKPFTTLHEVAHQIGYGSESEANLVSYMACMNNTNPQFKAAASFEVLMYGYTALRTRDSLLFTIKIKEASPVFLNNYKMLQQYGLKYKGPIDRFTLWLYDAYLKTNKQSSGTQSYSELIGWLIAYYNKNGVYP